MRVDQVLLAPIVTEKSLSQTGKYTFLVHSLATKDDLRGAMEEFYGIDRADITKVATQNMPAKFRMGRGGKPMRKRAERKKMIVTMREGVELDINSLK